MSYISEMREVGYDEKNINAFEQYIFPVIVEKLCGFAGKHAVVIDVGSGTGHVLNSLRKSGYNNLTAVDKEEILKDYFISRQIKFEKVDIASENFPQESGSVDIVFVKNVIEHLLDPALMMNNIHRILRPHGKIILITDDWKKTYKSFYRDPTHVHPYDIDSIKWFLKIHNFKITYASPFLTKYGAGRLKLYKLWNRLAFIGNFLIAIGEK